MKPKKLSGKLVLRKETVADLSKDQMQEVNGGTDTTTTWVKTLICTYPVFTCRIQCNITYPCSPLCPLP